MLETLLADVAVLLGVLHLAGPLAVRYTMRFPANCHLKEVPLEELPEEVVAIFRPRIPEVGNLGFELLGCYDCGNLASDTNSYVAYFCNRATNDFANISLMSTPKGPASYLEFSTRFNNGLVLETNTNRTIPLTPANPESRVFRFPKIQAPQTLYRVHRQLLDKYTPGLWAQGEPRGEELQRFVRVLENYGPRHARIGYMCPAEDGQSYKLTWKGAFFMTWRGLWPAAPVRRFFEQHAMQAELNSVEVRGSTVLQKA